MSEHHKHDDSDNSCIEESQHHILHSSTPVTQVEMSCTKLLILDLNKVLILRKLNKKSYNLRPFLTEFLTVMSSYFQLALWTSGGEHKSKRIVTKIFDKVPNKNDVSSAGNMVSALLFEWYQDRCDTDLTFRIPIANSNYMKPLHLKNLASVWESYPSFNEHNTILLDDSPEKNANNSPFSYVCPLPYTTHNLNDDELRPEGSLCSYLQLLAVYEGSVQDFIRTHPYTPQQKKLDLESTIAVPTSSKHVHGCRVLNTYIIDSYRINGYAWFPLKHLPLATSQQKNILPLLLNPLTDCSPAPTTQTLFTLVDNTHKMKNTTIAPRLGSKPRHI
eukprot:gene12997-27427_t